jgi:hypothetical protein
VDVFLAQLQESAVILRTVLEFCSQVDFVVLNEGDGAGTKTKAKSFIDDYFRDDWKPREEKQKRMNLRFRVDVRLVHQLSQLRARPARRKHGPIRRPAWPFSSLWNVQYAEGCREH